MKKAGLNIKKNNDSIILIFTLLLILLFVFGLKPIYQVFNKVKNSNLDITKTEENKKTDKEEYKILTPSGEENMICKNVLTTVGGEKTIKIYLYYTNNSLKSIQEDISYSGINDEYANYIMSEQSKYRQRKSNNIKLSGYSVNVELINTNSLDVSSVYLLDKITLEKVKLDNSDSLISIGKYNQDMTELVNEYILKGYRCE